MTLMIFEPDLIGTGVALLQCARRNSPIEPSPEEKARFRHPTSHLREAAKETTS